MPYQSSMHGERSTCARPARRWSGACRRSRLAGSFNYDRRGNLLTIGSAGSAKAFAYDHENQCVTAGGFNVYNKSDFVYDGKGRLRKRTDYTWNGSNWTPTGETRYVYDGMLLVQERTSASHPAVTYTRGLDLSGTLEGAGGIGGLLARTAHQSTSPYQPSTSAYYHADGNGNVTYLLNQARSHGASYKYDPYGRLIASSGALSSANLMRFSSKPWHDHSETYYYGYRFYLPEGQRWLNRDPLGELGGLNLYAFVGNSPVSKFDKDGRFAWVPVCCITCAGLAIWDVIDAIQDGTCAYVSASDRAACLLGKLVGNDLGGCVLEALGGVIKGGSMNEAKDKIADCFKCEGWKAARDVAKALSCACCMGGLASKIPVPKPMPPPLPAPAAL